MLLEVYGNPPAEKTDHADGLERLRRASEEDETGEGAGPAGPEVDVSGRGIRASRIPTRRKGQQGAKALGSRLVLFP